MVLKMFQFAPNFYRNKNETKIDTAVKQFQICYSAYTPFTQESRQFGSIGADSKSARHALLQFALEASFYS